MKRSIAEIKRIIQAAQYSYAGIRDGVVHHTSFRQEAMIGVILAPFAIWIGENGLEKAFLISALMLVLIIELINSAVETVVDRISGEEHELSRQAKDLGSAAVFVSLVNVPLM